MSDHDLSEWKAVEVTIKHTFRFKTLRCGNYETDERAALLEPIARQSIIDQALEAPNKTSAKGNGYKTEWVKSEYKNIESIRMCQKAIPPQVLPTDTGK
jgi:hypothetical protein